MHRVVRFHLTLKPLIFFFFQIKIMQCAPSLVLSHLVYVEQREELVDFLGFDEELWCGVPVSAGHLVLHLVHSSRSCCNPHTSWLMEADSLERYSTLLSYHYCCIPYNETSLESLSVLLRM